MSDYLDKAISRAVKEETITSDTMDFINSNFHDSPTFQRIGVSSYEFPDILEIDTRIVEVERMGSIREVLFRPYQGLNTGSYVVFDDEHWIITDVWGNRKTKQKALVQKCNHELKWKSKSNDIKNIMCIASQSPLGSKSNQGKLEIEWNKYDVMLPSGQLYLFVEKNDDTEQIEINQRFILGDNVYEVVGVDKNTLVNTSGFGITQLTTRITTRRDSDDFILEIASQNKEESKTTSNSSAQNGGRIW